MTHMQANAIKKCNLVRGNNISIILIITESSALPLYYIHRHTCALILILLLCRGITAAFPLYQLSLYPCHVPTVFLAMLEVEE